MDFVLKELIFLPYCWLALGAFGVVIEPFPENKVVLAGTTNATLTCSASNPEAIEWNFQPVGSSRSRDIYLGGDVVLDRNYYGQSSPNDKSSNLIIKKAKLSTAGTYSCIESATNVVTQLVVLSENPTCSFSPKETEEVMCNETLQLTCTVRYSANKYVLPSLEWFNVASSLGSLKSSVEKSTSESLTTATSTLEVTWPVDNPGAIPIYGCSTTFSLAANLPNEFVKKSPSYYNLCQPFRSADDVPCIQLDDNDNFSGEEINETMTNKTEKKTTNTTEKKNTDKPVTVEKTIEEEEEAQCVLAVRMLLSETNIVTGVLDVVVALLFSQLIIGYM